MSFVKSRATLLAIARLVFVDGHNLQSISRSLDQRYYLALHGLTYAETRKYLLGYFITSLSEVCLNWSSVLKSNFEDETGF